MFTERSNFQWESSQKNNIEWGMPKKGGLGQFRGARLDKKEGCGVFKVDWYSDGPYVYEEVKNIIHTKIDYLDMKPGITW